MGLPVREANAIARRRLMASRAERIGETAKVRSHLGWDCAWVARFVIMAGDWDREAPAIGTGRSTPLSV